MKDINPKSKKASRSKKKKGRAQTGKRIVNKGIGFCEAVKGLRFSCEFPQCNCHTKYLA